VTLVACFAEIDALRNELMRSKDEISV